MEIKVTPIAEVNAHALEVLYKEIGVVDTTRFMNQFSPGCGNYTEERDELLAGLSHDDIVAGIKKNRGKPEMKRNR